MAAPEMFAKTDRHANAGWGQADPRPSAVVLTLRPKDAHGPRLIEHAAGGRLGPAGGLLLGLTASAVLWIGIVGLAWQIFN